MLLTKRFAAPLGSLLLAVFLSGGAVAKTATNPSAPGPQPNVVTQVTNGILTLSIETISGQFTVTTGASHPHPNANVLYPIGTSFITFRDATALVMYTNTLGSVGSAGLAGYTTASMNQPSGFTTPLGTNGFRTVWPIPGGTWDITQDVILNGTTLADTNVQQTITIQNISTAPRQYGLRTMWDWYINGVDASIFRTRNPDTAFTSNFITYSNPTFQIFEEVDDPTNPTFSVFGTIGGNALSPAPTAPEQFRYSSWSAAASNAWDFANTGGGIDSATEYYWGFATPLTLAAGASVSYTQYLTTQLSAVGGTPSGPLLVPTLSQWGMLVLMTLLAAAALCSVRRRGTRR